MKTKRIVYVVMGAVLLVINLLVNWGGSKESEPSRHSFVYNIGQIISSHIFAVLGLIFLWMGYRIHKKIRDNEEEIDDIGKNN